MGYLRLRLKLSHQALRRRMVRNSAVLDSPDPYYQESDDMFLQRADSLHSTVGGIGSVNDRHDSGHGKHILVSDRTTRPPCCWFLLRALV